MNAFSMVEYYYDKGGIDKLERQYPEFFEKDPVLKVMLLQYRMGEASIVAKCKELEAASEND